MSHHSSGPDFRFPRGDARLDMTDFYAFPKPGDPGRSIIILNVHPSYSVNPPGPTTTEPFAPGAIYELKIDTDGDAVADLAYSVQFSSSGDGKQIDIVRFLWFLREEIILVLATSSSEPALPSLMTKLEKLGCSKTLVGLVVPTGYTFNADGTSLYMTMAALFVAQATNTHLTLLQQFSILGVALLSQRLRGFSGRQPLQSQSCVPPLPAIKRLRRYSHLSADFADLLTPSTCRKA